MNFVKTTDSFVASELSKKLKLINQNNGVWTFLNDYKQTFSDEYKNKIIYTDKIEMV